MNHISLWRAPYLLTRFYLCNTKSYFKAKEILLQDIKASVLSQYIFEGALVLITALCRELMKKKNPLDTGKKKAWRDWCLGLMPSQLQCPTRAPRSFTIAMKLPSVMKRWLQVSHLQPSCTYAQSERSRNPMRFRPPSRLSLQSSASKAWMFVRADHFERRLQGPVLGF